MQSIGEVRAIVFDVFGTVVDWRGSLIAELSEWGGARGLTFDWAPLVDAWRAGYAPSMDRVRRGEQPWTNLDDLHRATLEELVQRFAVPGLSDPDIEHINSAWHRLDPWPDAVAGLTRLKQRFVIATLSNGNVALLVDMAKRAGLPWDTVFGGDVFQHYKPDSETYLGACRLMELPPGRVMMAAAHNADLFAARACGLRTAFIPRPTEYGPHQSRDFGPEADWDIVAADITDLATQLGA